MAGTPGTFEIELELLLEAVYRKYQYDFRRYSPSSMERRVRLAVERLGCDSVSALQGRVLRDPALFRQLLGFLTIQVSDMFRDPPFWLALRRQVVPLLRTYPSLKVWLAGCSTGEECWSMAILLAEEGLLDRAIVYATDINQDALDRAAAGVYELERVAGFSEAYHAAGGRGSLSDYYTAGYGRAVFDKALRRGFVFSDHSLATDSVFAEVQLVCCRNVLIYFDRPLQDRALGLFADSLCRRGFLGLGAKETLAFSAHAAAFEDLAREQRIYQKR